ncbi:MAG TPA: hypothetical protein VHU80_04285, partial [Polyangiaceae bacterium]|nr:hypothetical protein [Polyangiaceae bacterium]
SAGGKLASFDAGLDAGSRNGSEGSGCACRVETRAPENRGRAFGALGLLGAVALRRRARRRRSRALPPIERV